MRAYSSFDAKAGLLYRSPKIAFRGNCLQAISRRQPSLSLRNVSIRSWTSFESNFNFRPTRATQNLARRIDKPFASKSLESLRIDRAHSKLAHQPAEGNNSEPSSTQLQSQASWLLLLLPLLAAGVFVSHRNKYRPSSEPAADEEDYYKFISGHFDYENMEPLPGRVGTLTPEQEEKLYELWKLVHEICGVKDEEANNSLRPISADGKKATSISDKSTKKKSGLSLFKKGSKKNKENVDPSQLDGMKEDDPEDKYGHNKMFLDVLANTPPESIRSSMWSMVKMDHPDGLFLRFLRARKWDVQRALVMLISTMKWRIDNKVETEIVVNGEEYFTKQEKEGKTEEERDFARGFLHQMRSGKSFCHGIDKQGRLMDVVKVRLHHANEQSVESMERFTIYLIETARLLLTPPVDTATVIFDMTGFSLANMDYTPVKFMIQCFEANYPESLGVVLIHRAPWVFQGIYKIIKGLLDPVVASKVHFTNNVKDLAEFIPQNHIMKELDGDEDWAWEYVEPIPGENEKMKDTATRDKLVKEREVLYAEFEKNTNAWLRETDPAKKAATKVRRAEIAEKLRSTYWDLDPYIRSRTVFDRVGIMKPGGKIDYYPEETAEKISAKDSDKDVSEAASTEKIAEVATAPAVPPAITTAPDDVD